MRRSWFAVPVFVVALALVGAACAAPPAPATWKIKPVSVTVDEDKGAAAELFAARGPAATSIRDIAAKSNVNHGLVFRQLVVVPYGRMQFVDVSAGPIERWAGIVTVQLHTASAASDARIPGLLPDEGARLRDRLAELGQALAAGL